ncbi:MAG: hypothetical protein AABY84_11365 [Candidatus Firestonebacteria bacterium]
MKNIEKYKKDLEQLISEGKNLYDSIQFECFPDEFRTKAKKVLKDKYESYIKALPSFKEKYQSWYSESLMVIKLLLPDRSADFVKLYEKPKTRKEITFENYVIEDCLQGLNIVKNWNNEKVVGQDAAIPRFWQQLNILKACEKRFESSLFDIKQMLRADLFDSELEAARELNNNGFVRGAGAMAGVVLEGHLAQVCENHTINIVKKNPVINDYNQVLKDAGIIEVHNWRFIQHLGDLRNLCDHDKKKKPTKEQVEELVTGVEKISKTIF